MQDSPRGEDQFFDDNEKLRVKYTDDTDEPDNDIVNSPV